MSRRIRVAATVCALVLGLCWGAQAQLMPVPTGQQGFSYPPTSNPVLDADPAKARPIAVGPVAEGGNVVRLRVTLPAFSGPVDLYFGVSAPALDPFHLYLLRPDGQLAVYESDLIPCLSGVTQPVDVFLFGDIPVSALPPGQYHLYLLASVAGNFSLYYLWHTYFVIRDAQGACGTYNGPRSFSMTFDHLAVVNWYGYSQEIRIQGVVPFSLDENNNLLGTGTLQISTQGAFPGGTFSGSGVVDEKLGGRLYFDENCQATLEVVFDEQFHPFPVSYFVGGQVISVTYPLENHNIYSQFFPVVDGATVSGPPVFPALGGSFNYILHLAR